MKTDFLFVIPDSRLCRPLKGDFQRKSSESRNDAKSKLAHIKKSEDVRAYEKICY